MKKHFLLGVTLVLVIGLLSVATAQNNRSMTDRNSSPIAKGKTIFSLQATELSATAVDTISAGDADQPVLFSRSLVGAKATVSYGVNDDWAINGAFTWATGYSKMVPADPADPLQKTSVNALGVRVGVDRHVQIANWFSFYGGPGVEWTTVGSKITQDTGTATPATYSNPRATTLSLTGRLGAFMRLSPKFGLYADLGHRLSMTSKTVRGKASELGSSHDGNIGFAVMF